MPTRLDWQVGPGGQGPEPVDPALMPPEVAVTPTGARGGEAAVPAPPRRRSGARLPIFVAFYLLVLGTAALIGFGLGRWSELQSVTRRRIENQLAIESLAWRDADISLIESTLDPAAGADWRRREIESFRALAPLPFQTRIVSIELVNPRLARVVAAVEQPTRDAVETRFYRWADGIWYRTPGP